MRARVVPPLLEYYRGRRYSCSQELGIIPALLGFRVDNSFLQPVTYYRSRTSAWDFLNNAAMGLAASLRVRLGLRALPRP